MDRGSRTVLVRNRSHRMAPVQNEPAWHPQGRMTMSGDMPLMLGRRMFKLRNQQL